MFVAMASRSEVPDDLITCSVCLNGCVDTKTLPCHHGFCLKCLETYYAAKQPDEMALCAVCRRDFRLPASGVRMLPHHFFIQRLIDIKNKRNQSDANFPPCKVCLAESIHKQRENVAQAGWFCETCSELLCEACCRPHKHMRPPHIVKALTPELNQHLRQRVCDTCGRVCGCILPGMRPEYNVRLVYKKHIIHT